MSANNPFEQRRGPSYIYRKPGCDGSTCFSFGYWHGLSSASGVALDPILQVPLTMPAMKKGTKIRVPRPPIDACNLRRRCLRRGRLIAR
jgi:hypothetical protein